MKTIKKSFWLIGFVLVFISCGTTQKSLVKVQRDGSSFEKAIVVNNIHQEYEYVKKVCNNCQILRQRLLHHKKKYYDVLEVKKPDGSKQEYYFDISKFYGKW